MLDVEVEVNVALRGVVADVEVGRWSVCVEPPLPLPKKKVSLRRPLLPLTLSLTLTLTLVAQKKSVGVDVGEVLTPSPQKKSHLRGAGVDLPELTPLSAKVVRVDR